ncbi:hypothetical protein [Jeongeupia naejangsanensis]|uniref:Copper resistance protein n=1 Tax=Jeongeupia naejangsanensis TaxID=613195 RepID=A0ABS2BIQ3_9NEIS|nr:hypothetical protein [Jeongeupia naejangsanensis]MBM3115479.1 hypothetical protein [Jeongeupia naejangsanensis]
MLASFKSSGLAWLVAILLVFAQLVTAAYACAEALPPQPSAPMLDMSDCDMQQMTQPVICKAHCQKEAQSADVQLPQLTAPFFVALFFASPYLETPDAAVVQARAIPPTLIAASPPLRIRYQVFRN